MGRGYSEIGISASLSFHSLRKLHEGETSRLTYLLAWGGLWKSNVKMDLSFLSLGKTQNPEPLNSGSTEMNFRGEFLRMKTSFISIGDVYKKAHGSRRAFKTRYIYIYRARDRARDLEGVHLDLEALRESRVYHREFMLYNTYKGNCLQQAFERPWTMCESRQGESVPLKAQILGFSSKSTSYP